MIESRKKYVRSRRWFEISLWASIALIFGLSVYAYCGAASVQHKAAIGKPGKSTVATQQSETPAPPLAAPQSTPAAPPIPEISSGLKEHLNTGDVIAALSSFYQAIIAILICLIALVAAFAVFTLKVLSRAAAEEIVYNAIKEKLESRHFKDDLQEMIDSNFEEKLREIRDIVERLEQRLAKLGGPSPEDVQGIIIDKELE